MKSALLTIISVIVAECLYLSRGIGPGQVSKVRVHRHTHYLTVDIMEFVGLVTECDDFCRAHKGTAKGIAMTIRSGMSLKTKTIKPCARRNHVCKITPGA